MPKKKEVEILSEARLLGRALGEALYREDVKKATKAVLGFITLIRKDERKQTLEEVYKAWRYKTGIDGFRAWLYGKCDELGIKRASYSLAKEEK